MNIFRALTWIKLSGTRIVIVVYSPQMRASKNSSGGWCSKAREYLLVLIFPQGPCGEAATMSMGDVLSVPTFRSCCRCGSEFNSSGREIICAGCRKPNFARHLSAREKQIVALITQAKANREIALEVHLAEGTIKEYLNRIFRKLEVKSRTELAIWD